MRRTTGNQRKDKNEGDDITVNELWKGTHTRKVSISNGRIQATQLGQGRMSDTVLTQLLSVFVPDGYPGTVRPGYTTFQMYDSIQGLCSYLRGVLSTQVILQGFGVGVENANALAATTQWVYRDGAGMIGGLLFAYVGRFDLDVKYWRLFADASVDVALTLEICSKAICGSSRECFTMTFCSANVLKSMCGVAAGATRAVITNHFAINANIADVQAKEGSQETFVNLVGMITGLWLANFVDSQKHDRWWLGAAAFVILTLVHLLSNYLAVRSLLLDTLNESRLREAICLYQLGKPLSIKSINEAEKMFAKSTYIVGCSLPKNVLENESLLRRCTELKCAVISNEQILCVALREDASTNDIIASIFAASVGSSTLEDGVEFVHALESFGWNCRDLYLTDNKYRYCIQK